MDLKTTKEELSSVRVNLNQKSDDLVIKKTAS